MIYVHSLGRAARYFPERIALAANGTRLTFRELHHRVGRIALFALGFGIVCSVAVTNTLLQKLVSDEMRGRVMSMFMLSFIGTMPIGNLIAGAVSQRFGVQRTLATGGLIIAIFVSLVAARSPRLRQL